MRIDILLKPDDTCDQVEKTLKTAAKITNVPVEIVKTHDFRAFANCAVNPSQTPAVIINGHVEFTGKELDMEAAKRRLKEIAYRKDFI